ncbi:hypothetical protein ACHAW6_008033 [Cyclotella cf. meneghiniana]
MMRLAGGLLAYNPKLQAMVAGSSTEAEFMMAYDAGQMSLYIHSHCYDLAYSYYSVWGNDDATAIANAGKPTP